MLSGHEHHTLEYSMWDWLPADVQDKILLWADRMYAADMLKSLVLSPSLTWFPKGRCLDAKAVISKVRRLLYLIAMTDVPELMDMYCIFENHPTTMPNSLTTGHGMCSDGYFRIVSNHFFKVSGFLDPLSPEENDDGMRNCTLRNVESIVVSDIETISQATMVFKNRYDELVKVSNWLNTGRLALQFVKSVLKTNIE